MHARHFEPTLWIFAFRVRQAVFHAMREKRDLFVVSVNPESLSGAWKQGSLIAAI